MARNYGLPRVEAEGRIVADPELKYNNSGKPWATFTIVQSSRRLNRDTNEWEDVNTTYLDCVANDELADNIAATLLKGTHSFVRGRLRQRDYTTQAGEKRRVFELLVDSAGPLLDRATASVTKGGTGGPAGGGWANSGNGSQPAYGSTQGGGFGSQPAPAPEQPGFGAFDDEQPF